MNLIENLSKIILFIFFNILNNVYADDILKNKNESFLKVDEAFQISLKKKSDNLFIVNFDIAKGYYLYKDKIKFFINNSELSEIKLPTPRVKDDDFFGKSKIYDNSFAVEINKKEKINTFLVQYQGCAERGLCYPPIKKELYLLKKIENDGTNFKKKSESEKIYNKLLGNSIFLNIILFLGFGLLLSFTPCVLPMIPILSGIILRSNPSSSLKSFLLSLYYVLGLCTLYFIVGLIIGYSNDFYNIQSIFQSPLFLISFIFILVFLALAVFGLYEIKIPNFIQKWASNISNKQKAGKYSSSYIMGFFSALIVGPCVAPPLAGIFLYVSFENPGTLITGILFLSLALGMSIPLLTYGTFLGKFLPKSGKWMKYINYLIGTLLLLVALTFLDRLFPIIKINNQENNLIFKKIDNSSDLKKYIKTDDDKISFIDIYADWCVECKIMEQKTFKDENVVKVLKDFRLIKIDVTDNSKKNKDMLRQLNVIGPPAYKFFDSNGREIIGFSIQGYMDPLNFLNHLNELNALIKR